MFANVMGGTTTTTTNNTNEWQSYRIFPEFRNVPKKRGLVGSFRAFHFNFLKFAIF